MSIYPVMDIIMILFVCLVCFKGDPKLDEENRQSSLPGKYLAPEKIKPHSQAPPTGMKSGGVIPSIATHQYMSGTSPVICPTVPLKERTTSNTQK